MRFWILGVPVRMTFHNVAETEKHRFSPVVILKSDYRLAQLNIVLTLAPWSTPVWTISQILFFDCGEMTGPRSVPGRCPERETFFNQSCILAKTVNCHQL